MKNLLKHQSVEKEWEKEWKSGKRMNRACGSSQIFAIHKNSKDGKYSSFWTEKKKKKKKKKKAKFFKKSLQNVFVNFLSIKNKEDLT